MKKINLKEAKRILKEQGYEIEVGYDEALLERFDLIYDLLYYFSSCFEKELDDVTKEDMKNFLKNKKDLIEYLFINSFGESELIADIYDDTLSYIFKELKNKSLSEIKLISNDMYEIINKDLNNACFYVLHYELTTSAYLNEIYFLDFKTAVMEFLGAKPINENDRVELIYSPMDNGDNIILQYKTL